ncbi:MAG TPA: PHB depolymerase family esterase [Polyangiaceae bacterium]|jgi:polyhydroxybutyrate depolymerase
MAGRFVRAVISSALLGCSHAATPRAAPAPDAADGAIAAGVDAGGATTTALTVDAGGASRLVLVHTPAGVGGAAPRGPTALVLNLHGSGGTAAGEEAYSGMDAVAEAHGFIVAYPQGAIALGGGFAWNVPGQPLIGGAAVPDGAADDVDFIARAVAAVEQAYPIDPKRVFATGMSGGARMTSQLGCDLSTVLAAVAPVAGLRIPSPCSGSRAVSVVAFHGTADTTNPYDGNGEAYWTYSVPVAEQGWATHDACNPTPSASQAAPNVTLTSYTGCTAGAAVLLYTIDGAGHEWPGAPGQTTAIDANEAMWAFFSAHPLP